MSQDEPDSTHAPADHRIAVIFGLWFLAGGLLFTVGSWGAYLRDTDLMAHGDRVQAQVVALERIRDTGSDGGTDYNVRFRFDAPDGRTVERQRALDRGAWSALRVGGPVEVAYDPKDPTRATLVAGGVTSLPMVLIFTVFGLAMGGGGLALVLAVAWRWWTRLRPPPRGLTT